ncbi:unnamed protein product [Amoebophrya sp. A120]|nr:unnamed protein product [Amoebophrya sp. A120]|eukprot:GSA120T00005355001.1
MVFLRGAASRGADGDAARQGQPRSLRERLAETRSRGQFGGGDNSGSGSRGGGSSAFSFKRDVPVQRRHTFAPLFDKGRNSNARGGNSGVVPPVHCTRPQTDTASEDDALDSAREGQREEPTSLFDPDARTPAAIIRTLEQVETERPGATSRSPGLLQQQMNQVAPVVATSIVEESRRPALFQSSQASSPVGVVSFGKKTPSASSTQPRPVLFGGAPQSTRPSEDSTNSQQRGSKGRAGNYDAPPAQIDSKGSSRMSTSSGDEKSRSGNTSTTGGAIRLDASGLLEELSEQSTATTTPPRERLLSSQGYADPDKRLATLYAMRAAHSDNHSYVVAGAAATASGTISAAPAGSATSSAAVDIPNASVSYPSVQPPSVQLVSDPVTTAQLGGHITSNSHQIVDELAFVGLTRTSPPPAFLNHDVTPEHDVRPSAPPQTPPVDNAASATSLGAADHHSVTSRRILEFEEQVKQKDAELERMRHKLREKDAANEKLAADNRLLQEKLAFLDERKEHERRVFDHEKAELSRVIQEEQDAKNELRLHVCDLQTRLGTIANTATSGPSGTVTPYYSPRARSRSITPRLSSVKSSPFEHAAGSAPAAFALQLEQRAELERSASIQPVVGSHLQEHDSATAELASLVLPVGTNAVPAGAAAMQHVRVVTIQTNSNGEDEIQAFERQQELPLQEQTLLLTSQLGKTSNEGSPPIPGTRTSTGSAGVTNFALTTGVHHSAGAPPGPSSLGPSSPPRGPQLLFPSPNKTRPAPAALSESEQRSPSAVAVNPQSSQIGSWFQPATLFAKERKRTSTIDLSQNLINSPGGGSTATPGSSASAAMPAFTVSGSAPASNAVADQSHTSPQSAQHQAITQPSNFFSLFAGAAAAGPAPGLGSAGSALPPGAVVQTREVLDIGSTGGMDQQQLQQQQTSPFHNSTNSQGRPLLSFANLAAEQRNFHNSFFSNHSSPSHNSNPNNSVGLSAPRPHDADPPAAAVTQQQLQQHMEADFDMDRDAAEPDIDMLDDNDMNLL